MRTVSLYHFEPSPLPWLYVPCWRKNTHGIILLRWLFIGIERIRKLNGDEVSILWAWGVKVKPLQKPREQPRGQPRGQA